MLDAEGGLIDGRNRLAACRLAGVAPRFAALNGHDPVSYILSSNVARRNLNKGQRAMAVARLRDVQKMNIRDGAAAAGVAFGSVSNAATILHYAPELADLVMAGAMSLDDAYTEARQRKEAQRSREEQAKRAEADLARLRAGAPDLAELVTEERMPLREALAAWRQRDEEEAQARRDPANDGGGALVKRGGKSPRVQHMVFNCSTDQARRRRAGRVWGNAQAVNNVGIRSGQTADLVPPDDAAAD